MELMLWNNVLENLYSLADMTMMNEIIASWALSVFCCVDCSNQIPDVDTIGQFRNILVHHYLQEELFVDVMNWQQEKGLLLMKGTVADSTLVAGVTCTNGLFQASANSASFSQS